MGAKVIHEVVIRSDSLAYDDYSQNATQYFFPASALALHPRPAAASGLTMLHQASDRGDDPRSIHNETISFQITCLQAYQSCVHVGGYDMDVFN